MSILKASGDGGFPLMMDSAPKDSQVDIVSTWRSEQPSKTTASMMTEQLTLVHAAVQTVQRRTMAIQTEVDQQAAAKQSKLAEAELPGFVSRMGAVVVSEMKRVADENEILEPYNQTDADDQEPAACIFELFAFGRSARQQQQQEGGSGAAASSPHANLVVTCLSWSCTGQTIAASFGRYDVAGWCTDRGALVTWNLGRENINPRKPDVEIDVDVCLMSCAFHPEHPALIAGGTFNGDLYVWDLSQEGDMQRAKSSALSEFRHREPICSIVWQYSLTEHGKYGNKAQAYRLVTLGNDGKVMVWVWHKLAEPVYGYQLLYPLPGLERNILWGGTCMSFSAEAKADGGNTFVIGTEGGRLFRCYFDMNDMSAKEFQRAVAAGDKVELRCPIKEAGYGAHAGAVYGVDCSPFHRELFLTCGADGTVRLNHSLKTATLMTLEPADAHLMSVAWSPFRPLVFAVAAGNGRVYMYDLIRTKDMVRPALALDVNHYGTPVYAQAFNAKKPDMFATGDATAIQIWRLPESLTGARKGEAALLRRVAASEDPEELLKARKYRSGAQED